jgi:hypothetical protein
LYRMNRNSIFIAVSFRPSSAVGRFTRENVR